MFTFYLTIIGEQTHKTFTQLFLQMESGLPEFSDALFDDSAEESFASKPSKRPKRASCHPVSINPYIDIYPCIVDCRETV